MTGWRPTLYDPALHARRIGLEWPPQRYVQLAPQQPRFTPTMTPVPALRPRHLGRNRALIGIGTLAFVMLIMAILRHVPAAPAPSYLNSDYLAKAMMRQANGGLLVDGSARRVTAALCSEARGSEARGSEAQGSEARGNEAQAGDYRCSLVFAKGGTAGYDVTVSPDGRSYIAMPSDA